jgi:hypothetical protein
MDAEIEIRRGKEAERLLTEPLLLEAFEVIEKEFTEAWKSSPAKDPAGRENIWLSLKLLHRVKLHLESVAVTGQMAKKSLAQQAREWVGQSASMP